MTSDTSSLPVSFSALPTRRRFVRKTKNDFKNMCILHPTRAGCLGISKAGAAATPVPRGQTEPTKASDNDNDDDDKNDNDDNDDDTDSNNDDNEKRRQHDKIKMGKINSVFTLLSDRTISTFDSRTPCATLATFTSFHSATSTRLTVGSPCRHLH